MISFTFKREVNSALALIAGFAMTAEPRLTVGSLQLTAGISHVAARIGLFGVSGVLAQLNELKLTAIKRKVSKIIPSWALVRKHLPLATRTSAIGVGIGALPGAGGDIAALMTYDHARRSVKDPEVPFAEGAVEGLFAPESANNAIIFAALAFTVISQTSWWQRLRNQPWQSAPIERARNS